MNRRQTATMVLASLAAFLASPLGAQQGGGPPTPIVEVAMVTVAEIGPTLSVPGTVYSRNDIQVTAGVGGRLDFVAEPGTRVKKGEPLASIDSTTLRLQRAEQEALLARARIQVRQLESEWRRQNELRATNVVSEFQLEQTASNRDLAKADADIIAVRIRQIDERIRRATTRAAFNGIVTTRLRREGEEVAQGAQLGAFTDTDNLEVRAFIPLKHLTRTHINDELDIFDDQHRMRGTIRALIPAGDVRSQTFEARIDLSADARVLAAQGQLVSVAIPIRAREASLAIPRDALVLRSEGSYVYRIRDDNTAERISVELGDSAGDLIAVNGLLSEGDRVAIRGGETLTEGATVRIADS